MWCGKCQSEVAAEATADNQRCFCTTCGTELTKRRADSHPAADSGGSAPGNVPLGNLPPGNPPSGTPRLDPQSLLAKWAEQPVLEPLSGPHSRAFSRPTNEQPSAPPPRASGRKVRIDAGTSPTGDSVRQPHVAIPPGRSRPPHGPVSLADADLPRGYRVDPAGGALRGPHFDPRLLSQLPPPKTSNWIAAIGQFLAYVGSATLAVGAALVLVGYLGGPSHYAPTGWFTTTIGQMLLFLGVVTLVSAGMEQTTFEVTRRVDALGNQLERLEMTTGQALADADREAELQAEINELRRQLAGRG